MAQRTLDATRRSAKARTLAQKFNRLIVGQNEAKEALTNLLDKYSSGVYDKTRPIGSLLFLGPTGVGKTGTVEAFAEGLFGDARAVLRVDCAEFQHSHEIAKLIGSPPGYLGHRETHPFFTQEALNQWHTETLKVSIVLFDEIEKASDSLWKLLLGILDKATLTLGDNRKVDFSQAIVIMTSNIGAAELADDSTLGFSTGEKIVDDTKLKTVAMSAAKRKFAPEFLNRLDHIVYFKTLTQPELREIAGLMLEKVQDRILTGMETPFEIRVTESAMEQILAEGYDTKYNARELRRVIEKYVAGPMTRLLATGQIQIGDVVRCDYLVDWGEWRYTAEAGNYANKKSQDDGVLEG